MLIGSAGFFFWPIRYTAMMSRFLRYLRIAFSATCLIACVLLIVLWVRSYWRMDDISRTGGTSATISLRSDLGRLEASTGPAVNLSSPPSWQYWGYEQAPSTTDSVKSRPWFRKRFRWHRSAALSLIEVPHWFLIIISGTISVLPWIRPSRRFSLRTLLLATTLVAAVLGLIVWLSR